MWSFSHRGTSLRVGEFGLSGFEWQGGLGSHSRTDEKELLRESTVTRHQTGAWNYNKVWKDIHVVHLLQGTSMPFFTARMFTFSTINAPIIARHNVAGRRSYSGSFASLFAKA